MNTEPADSTSSIKPGEEPEGDLRLYAPDPGMVSARIKPGGQRDYCFMQNPGEDHFHLLMDGEIYIQSGDEKYCLNCALRRGLITRDRLNWQHGTGNAVPGL